MAFNLGATQSGILPPPSWAETMAGFTSPAEILRTSAPFTAALEAKKNRELELGSQLVGEAGSNYRTKLANDTTEAVARMRLEEGNAIEKRATLARFLSTAPNLASGFAGQVFGVGAEGDRPSATQQLTARLRDQNDYLDELWRSRQDALRWQKGSVQQAGTIAAGLPQVPQLGS